MADRRMVQATVLVAFAVASVACAGPSDDPARSGLPVVATPEPTVAPRSKPSEADIEKARHFRETFGLRADPDWIMAVALNRAARGLFGVPLLPHEQDDLLARTQAQHDIGPVIMAYGRTVPDDWYVSWIDQRRGGIFIVEFRQNEDRHREVLTRLLPPTARLEVRRINQQTLDREAFVARVKADKDWLATIGAELLDVVTNPMDGGIVELTYLADRRDLDPAIRDHYDAPDWVRIERAGAPY